MNIKLKQFTEFERARLNEEYLKDPLYRIQKRHLASYYFNKSILKEEEIWFLAKRLFLYLADNKDINNGVVTHDYCKALHEAIYDYTINKGIFTEYIDGGIKTDEDEKINCVIRTIVTQAYLMGYITNNDEICININNNSDDEQLECINNAKDIVDEQMPIEMGTINYSRIKSVFEYRLYSSIGDNFKDLCGIDFKEKLLYYKRHPLFKECYIGAYSGLCGIYKYRNQHFCMNDVVYLFDEVEFIVRQIVSDKDLIAENLHEALGNLVMECEAMKEIALDTYSSMYDQEVKILELMLVMIAAYKNIDDIDEETMNVFKHTRCYCEHHSQLWKHYEQRPLWYQLCEIVPTEEVPSYGDLQVMIKQLNEKAREHDGNIEVKNSSAFSQEVHEKDMLLIETLQKELSEKDNTITTLRNNLNAANQQINELKDEIDALSEGPLSEAPYANPRLELTWKLYENAKLNLNIRGNKQRFGRLLEYQTGIPYNTCKKYITDRVINSNYHAEIIKDVNQILNCLQVPINL